MYFSKPGDPPNLATLLESIEHAENQNIAAYDKVILTVASAALALSLTFTKDLVPFESARYLWVLVLSWFGFVLTLAINVGGFVLTLWLVPRRTEMAFSVLRHRNKTQADLESSVLSDQTVNRWMNISQGVVFLAAMILLTFYVCDNVLFGPNASWATWAQMTAPTGSR
jgi:hypothetical protein